MANIPVEGKNIVFMLDSTNVGTSYDLVVCLNENSFERTANVIDASSKCGTHKFNGTKDRTINISGNVVFTPDANCLSEAALNDLFENDTPFAWLFGPEDPGVGEDYYTGTGAIISSLSLSAPKDGAATFSATIQLNGVPTREEGS